MPFVYKCALCPPYKTHTKIRWMPELKQRICDEHFEEILREEGVENIAGNRLTARLGKR